MLLNGSQQAAQQRYVHSPTSSDDAMKPKGRNCVARRCGVMVYRQARASKMSANIPCPPIFQRGIKKLSAAPFNQGATGPKPKRRQIVIKLFLSNNVEIISYLHYTIVIFQWHLTMTWQNEVAFLFLSPNLYLMRKILSVQGLATFGVSFHCKGSNYFQMCQVFNTPINIF